MTSDIILLTGQYGRGKVAVDGRPHEVDGVDVPLKVGRDDNVFQEVRFKKIDR